MPRVLADPNSDFLLAGDPPAGVCQLRYRYSIWTEADDCWLEDIFVEEEARGSGMGRELMDAAFDRARERGCRRMELDVNEANPAALALYDSLGFRRCQTRPAGGTCSCAGVCDLVHLVAHRDRSGLDDVGAQAGAVDHALEDARAGDALDVVAGLAPLHADRLDLADAEPLVQQVVQPNAGGEHLAADLGVAQRNAGLLGERPRAPRPRRA